MFEYFEHEVLRNEWLSLSLWGGMGLMMGLALWWLPMQVLRKRPFRSLENKSTWRETFRMVPWILILTYAGMLVYGIAMTVAATIKPPNW